MAERVEVMWCTVCGQRFSQDEIKGWGCPTCKNQGVPCDCKKDVTVEINWHELHVLCVWAENFAGRMAEKPTAQPDEKSMPQVVHAIARRLQAQHPNLGHLTLRGEIATLASDLAARGVEVTNVETNIGRPPLLPVNGPGAVGHAKARESK